MSHSSSEEEDFRELSLLDCRGDRSADDRTIIITKLNAWPLTEQESLACTDQTNLDALAWWAMECRTQLRKLEKVKEKHPREPVMAQYVHGYQLFLDSDEDESKMLGGVKRLAECIADGKYMHVSLRLHRLIVIPGRCFQGVRTKTGPQCLDSLSALDRVYQRVGVERNAPMLPHSVEATRLICQYRSTTRDRGEEGMIHVIHGQIKLPKLPVNVYWVASTY